MAVKSIHYKLFWIRYEDENGRLVLVEYPEHIFGNEALLEKYLQFKKDQAEQMFQRKISIAPHYQQIASIDLIKDVINYTSIITKQPIQGILGKSGDRELVDCRKIISGICNNELNLSVSQIVNKTGFDRSTTYHYIRQCMIHLQSDIEFKNNYDNILGLLK